MTPESVAKRLDNRPGYVVASYSEIALPVFLIQATAVTMEVQERSCIEEFALRAIAAGLGDPDDVQGLLGISGTVVDATLADLVRQAAVRVDSAGRLVLLEHGRAMIGQVEAVPAEHTILFPYDGVLRRAKWYPVGDLYTPRDVKARGVPTIRPMPVKGPEVNELSVSEVAEVYRLMARSRRGEREVLRVRSIEKRLRRFLIGVALVYRPIDGGDVQVSFAIDGRLSTEHEMAFARGGGLERQPAFAGLRVKRDVARELKVGLPEGMAALVDSAGSNSNLNLVITTKRAAADHAAIEVVSAKADSDREAAERGERVAVGDLQHAEAQAQSSLVRPLPVYEHPDLLVDALTSAKTRVHIVSPWIRSGVVDRGFLRTLRELCTRGVRVSIGYGISEHDAGERPDDRSARQALEQLSKELSSLRVRRLGDTHAKVLIKDSEYFVITSFNWLSFRGDPGAPFREEWGTIVRDAAAVDEFYDELLLRFNL